ncbi:hypothetical protein RHSIM_Rhsim02G0021800 [Rhododendron simsii]|uniref:Pentatricopeptide repeat-containing protein n=1 Tax=Rhododendron simsii TaxID=118357 RepID=A0A834HK54_RHOSS|nr:hypothetical protein RHSIM_Rhsim02G0021800 [Rhododendron simsii]
MPFLTPAATASLPESAMSTHSPLLGRSTHAQILKTLSTNPPLLSNHLIHMYSKLDLPSSAHLILRLTPTRSVVTWTSLISSAVRNGHFSLPIPLLQHLHGLAIKDGQMVDAFVGCSAFDMYCKTGLRDDACKVFDEMPHRNLATWNACISNCVLDRRPDSAVSMFIEFRRSGFETEETDGFVIRYGYEADVSVANGWIDFYGKCHEMGCFENDEQEKACLVFVKARTEGIEPTDYMVSSVLSACAGLAGLELGRSVHALAVKACVEKNVLVGSALVEMRVGTPRSCGHGSGIVPRNDTWNPWGGAQLCDACVLSACSTAGVKMGMEIFELMRGRYGIKLGIGHYACVVDLLAQALKVEEAYEFIRRMPIRPNVSIWGTLLGVCRVYGKPEPGRVAAENLFELDPHDSGNHVLLSNVFAASGSQLFIVSCCLNNVRVPFLAPFLNELHETKEANIVRKEMKDIGIKKGVGCSCITVKNSVHVSQAKDNSWSPYTDFDCHRPIARLSSS